MPKSIQLGNSNFGELITTDGLFADKSLFAEEVINDPSKTILITRPRRWGKTLNLSMLQHFLANEVYGQKTAGLFDELKVAKIDNGAFLKQHQGKYPVIFISFKDVKALDFEDAYTAIYELIIKTFDAHNYLEGSDRLSSALQSSYQTILNYTANISQLEKSLLTLAECLYVYHQQKVFILIDEYDTPLNSAFDNHDYFDRMSLFTKNMLSAGLKDNPYLQKGVLTGILRVSKDSMLSTLNHLRVYTVLDKKYAQHFGFTDTELDYLFADQGLSKDEERIKAWYNGYLIGGITLYNPWSIMNSLHDGGELRPYWVNTANDSLLKELLQNATADVKIQFQSLVQGNSIDTIVNQTMRFDEVKRDPSMLWNLLLSAGYLKILSSSIERNHYRCQLAIPNQEVLGLYEDFFLDWMISTSQFNQLKILLQSLVQGDIDRFTTEVSQFLKSAASIHDYATQPEAFYHGFILALTIPLMDEYYVLSNTESGFGRPDLVLVPKNKTEHIATIVEFKHVPRGADPKTIAEQALQQITYKSYQSKIAQYDYVTQIRKIGIAFDGKNVYSITS